MSDSSNLTLATGLHYDIPAARYHSDPCEEPSLSSGLLRTMLAKSPAHGYREHPKLGGGKSEATAAMNTGSIVHDLLAGGNSELEVGNFDSFRSAAARTWRDCVIESGKTPVLESDLDEARKIVASVSANVCNGGITNTPFADHGKSEVTAIWREGEAYCRARYDRLVIDPNGFADVWDWKTTTDVSDRGILGSLVKYGYHVQAAFYLRGLAAALPSHAGRTSFTFVFVETVAPFSVRRVCLSPEFASIGAKEASRGINLWRECMASGKWPDHSHATLTLDAPAYLIDDEISDSISTD